VPGFYRNTKLEQLGFAISHVRNHSLRDVTKVLVFHFLAFRGSCTNQGSTRVKQVRPCKVKATVDKEIFLFRAYRGEYFFRIFVAKETKNTKSLSGKNFHRFKQRSFFVEDVASPTKENRRDNKSCAIGAFQDVSRAGWIPTGIATRFKGGTNTAGGEGTGVRFAFDEFFATEFDHGFS
jgi:hypothetical protein